MNTLYINRNRSMATLILLIKVLQTINKIARFSQEAILFEVFSKQSDVSTKFMKENFCMS